MTEKERKERELRNIEELRMIDDTFFAAVFDGQTAETEVLIRTILNRDDITVVEAKVQNFIPNLRGHGVSLDILAWTARAVRTTSRCRGRVREQRRRGQDLQAPWSTPDFLKREKTMRIFPTVIRYS